MKFYLCKVCGNMITFVHSSGAKVICCGEPMQEMVPHTQDAGAEKHVPVVHRNKGEVTVEIGSVAHPMIDKHFIQWIVLETKNGVQGKKLQPGDQPKAKFYIAEDDEILATYEYCNVHGLWKK